MTYLDASAVVRPMSAWLSRVFGRKNHYPACVSIATVIGPPVRLDVTVLSLEVANVSQWRLSLSEIGTGRVVHDNRPSLNALTE